MIWFSQMHHIHSDLDCMINVTYSWFKMTKFMIYDQYRTKDMGISDHQQHIQLTYQKKKKKKDSIYIYSFIWWTVNCTGCSMTLSTSSSIWMSLHYAYEIKYPLLKKLLCFSNQLNAFFVTVRFYFRQRRGSLCPDIFFFPCTYLHCSSKQCNTKYVMLTAKQET